MRVSFTFRNVQSSEALKSFATEKLERLRKYSPLPPEVDVILSNERHLFRVDMTAQVDGERFAGFDESEDIYHSLTAAIDRIDRQIRDSKAAETSRRHHGHV